MIYKVNIWEYNISSYKELYNWIIGTPILEDFDFINSTISMSEEYYILFCLRFEKK